MTTTIKHHEIHTPNGKVLHHASRPLEPVDVEILKRQRDAWLAKNRHLLEGYDVEQFLREKHRDVEEGLA